MLQGGAYSRNRKCKGPAHPATSHFLYMTPPFAPHTRTLRQCLEVGRQVCPDSVHLEQSSPQSTVCARVCLCVVFFCRNKTRRGREKHNASSSTIERRELQCKSSMCCTACTVCVCVCVRVHTAHRSGRRS